MLIFYTEHMFGEHEFINRIKQSAPLNSTKKIFSRILQGVEFRVAFSIGGQWSETVKLSGLVELPVIELTSDDCMPSKIRVVLFPYMESFSKQIRFTIP